MKRVVVLGATPLGVEMAGNLGHRGLAGGLRRRGPVGAVGGARPRRRRAGARVAREARRDAAPGHQASRSSSATDARARRRHVRGRARVRRRDRLPAQAAEHRAGRGRSGLEIGTTGGVMVDEHMRTSKPDVWAAGDVVEVPHGLSMLPIRGLTGSHAYAQGRTAAFNAAGRDLVYDPVWIPWGMVAGDYTIGGFSIGETLATAMGVPYVRRQGRRRLARPLLPGRDAHARQAARRARHAARSSARQIHGGEGVKERSDFLAFAAKRGATLDDLAWMENIYSPPIGALFEPIAIAAQNGLAELRDARARDGMSRSPTPSAGCASAPSTTCCWPRCAARQGRARHGRAVPRPRRPAVAAAVRAAVPAAAVGASSARRWTAADDRDAAGRRRRASRASRGAHRGRRR